MSGASGDALGWYGKIPALGDFASRRLPAQFVTLWDAWLQHSIAASRARLAEQWLDLYLTSPIWRFALAPGVCGDTLWAGVLMPSVDSVGRHFPLTLVLSVAPPCSLATVLAAQRWYAAVEAVALSALRLDGSLDDLERAIAQLPVALHGQVDLPQDGAIGALAEWWQSCMAEPLALQLDGALPMEQVADTAMRTMFDATGRGRSLWWSSAPDTGVGCLHCCTGLPPHDYFVALLECGSH